MTITSEKFLNTVLKVFDTVLKVLSVVAEVVYFLLLLPFIACAVAALVLFLIHSGNPNFGITVFQFVVISAVNYLVLLVATFFDRRKVGTIPGKAFLVTVSIGLILIFTLTAMNHLNHLSDNNYEKSACVHVCVR